MKFTEKQIKEIKSINNIDDLLKMFKRLIYISDVSYIDLQNDGLNKTHDMIDSILQ